MKFLMTLLAVVVFSSTALSTPAMAKSEPLLQANGSPIPLSELDLPADGELGFAGNTVVATLELDNQSVLKFVQLADDQIAILEDAPSGAISISSVGIPDDAAIAEVFYAFSLPGTPIPPALKGSEQINQQKPQGWARSLVNQQVQVANITTGNCSDTNFRNWFNNFPYNDRGTPDFRLNQVPRNSNFFERYRYAPGNGQSYRFYRYTVGGNNGSIWYNIDRYASRVAVCALDSIESENPGALAHPPISYQGYSNGHMGPVVRMMYRRPNQTTWTTANIKDFSSSDVGSTLSWHFYTGNNWDWRTDIYWAGGDDSFDIGHALEDL